MHLRLITPILVTVGMIAFVGLFSEFLLASIFLKDVDSQTLAVGLYALNEADKNKYFGPFCAGALLASIPIVAHLPGRPEAADRRNDRRLGQVTQRAITPTLLSTPHHDGSALYVSELAPGLGDVVSVLVARPGRCAGRRTSTSARSSTASRSSSRPRSTPGAPTAPTRGGGPGCAATTRSRATAGSSRRSHRVCVAQRRRTAPAGRSRRRRLPAGRSRPSAAGLVAGLRSSTRCSPTGSPSRPARCWRVAAAAGYPTGPSRRAGRIPSTAFGVRTRASSSTAATSTGITDHLDHLERLGIDILYLTPFFPARSNHRYDATTFGQVDPVLGRRRGAAPADREAHRRGMRVLGDITTNHTGDSHEWFVARAGSESSPERDFYFWTTREDYVGWLGVTSLPKLNWDSAELRRRFLDDPDGAIRRWLGPRGRPGRLAGRRRQHDRPARPTRPLPRRSPRGPATRWPRPGRTRSWSPSTATTTAPTCRATAGTGS